MQLQEGKGEGEWGKANEALDAFTMSADTSDGGSRSSCHLVPPAALGHKRVPLPTSPPPTLPLKQTVRRVLPANVNAKCERTFGKQVRTNCPEGRRHVAGSQARRGDKGRGVRGQRGEGLVANWA